VTLINAPSATNATKSFASLHGDRIELHSLSTNRPASPRRLHPRSAIPDKPVSGLPVSITNSAGGAQRATTLLRASRDMFLNSTAAGNKTFTVKGTTQVGSWLSLVVTKTNGASVTVSFTNQSLNATPYDMAVQLVSLINSNSALQQPNGLFAEDLREGFLGAGSFTLRSGSAGLQGAATRVILKAAANLLVSPTNFAGLDDNLLDTQPRNHLYLTAGLTNLTATFSLDTRNLADGYHELSAVAYEGSHVRTQTKLSIPVIVQNATLSATLVPIDLGASNSVQGTYHFQVSANSANIASIRLFSTGGEYAAATNESTSSFTIKATDLGAGLHPFYAAVESTTGDKFRTETYWTRFVH